MLFTCKSFMFSELTWKKMFSFPCFVRKSEKICLSQHFSKILDVEFQKWHVLYNYVPEFHIYVSIHGNNKFPGSYISKSVGIYM